MMQQRSNFANHKNLKVLHIHGSQDVIGIKVAKYSI
jgi:hypothetical protein